MPLERPGIAFDQLPLIANCSFAPDRETSALLSNASTLIAVDPHGRRSEARNRAFSKSRTFMEAIACEHFANKPIAVQDYFHRSINSRESKSERLRIDVALDYVRSLEEPPSINCIKEAHKILLDNTTRELFESQLRASNDLVGGNRYCDLDDNPPLADDTRISEYLDDLVLFCRRSDIPPVAKAAIAHLQLIGIHPFKRANGKLSLLLSHMVLLDGSPNRKVVPITISFAISLHEYQSRIKETLLSASNGRYDARTLNRWIRYFANCCQRAARNAATFEQQITAFQDDAATAIGARSDAAVNALIDALPSLPVFTVSKASEETGRSFKRTSEAAAMLLDAGTLVQISAGKRNRVFECPEVLSAYSTIEGFQ